MYAAVCVTYLAAMCAQKQFFLRVCWKALSPQVRRTLDTLHKAPEEINVGSSRLYLLYDKNPTPAVSYGKQIQVRTETGNIIHVQLIIQAQVWCSACDRMIDEARVYLLKTSSISGRNESSTKTCSLIVTEGEL